MTRSIYVSGVPFPTSTQQQQQEAEAEDIRQQQLQSSKAQTAIETGSQGAPSQLYGDGSGNRMHVSPQSVQLQLQGKPAFFDTKRGLLFDGQNLYCYKEDAITAIENTNQQQQPLGIAEHQQQRAMYQEQVRDMNSNRSVYLFSA